jgi:hypothetical protein
VKPSDWSNCVPRRYHRQRLDLYRARLYAARALSLARLEEFQRASADAAARLRQAVEEAPTAHEPPPLDSGRNQDCARA